MMIGRAEPQHRCARRKHAMTHASRANAGISAGKSGDWRLFQARTAAGWRRAGSEGAIMARVKALRDNKCHLHRVMHGRDTVLSGWFYKRLEASSLGAPGCLACEGLRCALPKSLLFESESAALWRLPWLPVLPQKLSSRIDQTNCYRRLHRRSR